MRKSPRLLLAAALCALAGTLRAELPADYQLVLLTENFPPYNFALNGKNFARDAGIRGIAADVVREMLKRAGVPYHLTLRFPWSRIYQLAQDKPDHGVFVTARLPEREALFKWVGPLGPDDWVLLARADSEVALTSLAQAKDDRIGAYKGDAIEAFLQDKGVATDSVLNDMDNAVRLEKGQIDLWATGDPAGRYLARQAGVSGLKTVLRFNQAELFLALNPQTPDEVVHKLQAALDQMRAEGFVDKTINQYLQ